jgi:hypothetical protein
MFADISQPIKEAKWADPVEVVEDLRRIRAIKVEESVHLAADSKDIGGDLLTSKEVPFLGASAGVANHPGGSADYQEGTVARLLEVGKGHYWNQVAEV